MTALESWEITPTCRANRGLDGAWQEAVDQLRQVYKAQVTRFGPTATITLSISRERAAGVPAYVYEAVRSGPALPVEEQCGPCRCEGGCERSADPGERLCCSCQSDGCHVGEQ